MAHLSDYDYELPEKAIAQTPLEDRAASKLLFLNRQTGAIQHLMFRQVAELLAPGDLLIANNTRVTALRLVGEKHTGAKVEVLLLKPLGGNRFEALAKPGARLQPGAKAIFPNGLECEFEANLEDGKKRIRLTAEGDVDKALESAGVVPLPPYIHYGLADPERYQTVYASQEGSAAAPTAGLHFTNEILADLRSKNVDLVYVTLDVGLDTFRPINSENLEDHNMHGERCFVSEETAGKIANAKGRIIAVGTTVVRTLESFACGPRQVFNGTRNTNIFIRPGFRFQVIDGMFTNFHMPRTTMLVMIDALIGREMLFRAYREALDHDYRFLSFGDSMLIL